VPKSGFAENLDLVQTQFTGVLRPLGFRKSGRTYNRLSPDGLTQVINLQIRRPDPIPPQLADIYAPGAHDRFTVNLGVWVPEVAKYHLVAPRSTLIQEYDCQIRARLGDFVSPPEDVWWPLDDSWPQGAAAALQLLESGGLPFLEQFGTRDGIVAGWLRRAPDSNIVIAIIEAQRGHAEQARALLAEQIGGTQHRGHQQYVRVVASQLGIQLAEPQ
jgi:uncharacterized protein DUF4304